MRLQKQKFLEIKLQWKNFLNIKFLRNLLLVLYNYKLLTKLKGIFNFS